jgi:hypothetical protein
LIAIGKFFSDQVDWHQDSRVSPLVRQYQTSLDSLLESNDKLGRCIKHCLDCGIRFLTAPQNAGREDLRCPFGCAKRHRAQQSNERVKAYRRTERGKKNKDALNATRYRSSHSTACESPCEASANTKPPPCEPVDPADSPLAENASQPLPAELSVVIALDLDGVVLDESWVVNSPMLPYIRTLIWIIDGIRLSHVEVVEWLRRVLRQRSMAYRPRRDYVLRFLHQHPP